MLSKQRKSTPEEREVSKKLVAAERDFNGGKCYYELYKEELSLAKKQLTLDVAEVMEPVINFMRTRSDWKYSTLLLAFTSGRLSLGEDNGRIAGDWSVYEFNRHKNPPEGYLKDLQDAYKEMWLECKKLIDDHRIWYHSIVKVKRPCCIKDSPFFWGSVKPFRIDGGYSGKWK